MARKTKEEANQTRQQIIDAARTVFHRHGVGHSSLEQVAQAAGLTRGAVYWHFKNKAELFFAMREDAFVPLRERIDAILFSSDYDNPLDAIEASLKAFFRALDECRNMREILEIMALRCEYVDEFADVQEEADRPAREFLAKVEKAYQTAAAKGALRGLDPAAAAKDTWVFVNGLLQLLLANKFGKDPQTQIAAMISAHMALRRPL